MTEELRPIYIAGRGHSGTTFLDVLIGNAPEAESIGEVVSGLNRGPGELCSCGETVGDCAYWNSVRAHYEQSFQGNFFDDAKWLCRMSDVRNFLRWWFADTTKEGSMASKYVRLNRQLLESVSVCCNKSVICDSNKEFSRALLYLRGWASAKVVHIVRDPVSIIGSHYFRQEKGMPLKFMKREYYPGFLRFPVLGFIAATWNVAVVLGILLKWRFPDRVLHLSYQKLCVDPEKELRRLGEFLSIDMSAVIDGVNHQQAFPVGHNVGGNELRHEKTFTFIQNSKGRRQLPLHYRILSAIVTVPGRLLSAMFVDFG